MPIANVIDLMEVQRGANSPKAASIMLKMYVKALSMETK